DTDGRPLALCITVPLSPQPGPSGGGQTALGGVVWDRRTFAAPPAERLLLHLGAVDYRATVWVNGEEVAAHEGGHTPFTADISRVARDTDNEIVVRVEDPLDDRTIPRCQAQWTTKPRSLLVTAHTDKRATV